MHEKELMWRKQLRLSGGVNKPGQQLVGSRDRTCHCFCHAHAELVTKAMPVTALGMLMVTCAQEQESAVCTFLPHQQQPSSLSAREQLAVQAGECWREARCNGSTGRAA